MTMTMSAMIMPAMRPVCDVFLAATTTAVFELVADEPADVAVDVVWPNFMVEAVEAVEAADDDPEPDETVAAADVTLK